jgi:hypothetical protein
MRCSAFLVLALAFACVATVRANSEHGAAESAPAPLTWTVSTNVDAAIQSAIIATGCLAGPANTSAVGTVTVSIAPISPASTSVRTWPNQLNVGVYDAATAATITAITPCATLLSSANGLGVATVSSSTASFMSINVNHVGNTVAGGALTWTVVLFTCADQTVTVLPALTATVAFNQSTSALASSHAVCPGVMSVPSHKIQVAVVAAFGGVIWLATVFFVVKNTCSQQFFSFTNFLTSVPAKHAVTTAAEEHHDLEMSERAPARKIRLDPSRQQHASIKQSLAVVQTITSFKAMPPRFAIALGSFVIIVVTGVWMSLLLAAMAVENWPSYIGAGVSVVLIALIVLWFVSPFLFNP